MLLHVQAKRVNESEKELMTMRFLKRFSNENQFSIEIFYLSDDLI
jgi:hypothetical protein